MPFQEASDIALEASLVADQHRQYAVAKPYRAGADRRRKTLQGDVGCPLGTASHLRAADQLPDLSRGHERLRITPTPLHSDADIDALVGGLARFAAAARCAAPRDEGD